MTCARLLPFLLATPGLAQVRFDELASVDLASTADPLSGHYVGTLPTAVAWDGTNLYVAGTNAGAGPGVAIVRVRDALTTPAFDAAFAVVSDAPTDAGYTGLDVGFGVLVAAYDAGAEHPRGLQAFSASNLIAFWSAAAHGASGVAIDPG